MAEGRGMPVAGDGFTDVCSVIGLHRESKRLSEVSAIAWQV
jgi:hypothetical protein